MKKEEDEEQRLWRVHGEAVRNLQRIKRLHRMTTMAQGVLGFVLLLLFFWNPPDSMWLGGLMLGLGAAFLVCAIRSEQHPLP